MNIQKGWTILHIAVKENDLKMVKFFIKEKGDINVITTENQTALDIAEELNYKKIIALLIKNGAKRYNEIIN